jgi:hypothetical protein
MDDMLGTISKTPILSDLPIIELGKAGHAQSGDSRSWWRKRLAACDLPTLNQHNHDVFAAMVGAAYDLLAQSGGTPVVSREQAVSDLTAAFAVQADDLKRSDSAITDRNIAAMARLIGGRFPDSRRAVRRATDAARFLEVYQAALPVNYHDAYLRALGIGWRNEGESASQAWSY